MDLQCSEETKCNNRKKSRNPLNIFPIYTVAFTVSEIYEKPCITEENNDLDYSINSESASSTTLKNKGSVEVTKFIVNSAKDVEETPIIPVHDTRSVTKGSLIVNNNAIDYSENIKQKNNNNKPRTDSLPNSIKYIKKPLKNQNAVFSTMKSKPKKCTRLVKIKNTYFKKKHPENNLNKKLETYYDRAKTKCTNAGKIQKKIYSDSILNAVSLTRILKKVLAKENLLEDIDKISLNGNHILDKMSNVSEGSQHTLTRERSISSDNSDFNNTKALPSVIDVSNYTPIKNINSFDTIEDNKLKSNNISSDFDKIENPYKRDIISVAVACIDNASILNYKKEPAIRNSREKFIIKESLTSAESYLSQTTTESSTSSFEMLNKLEKEDHPTRISMNDSGVSSQTLTESQNIFNITSESDRFVIAKTSSYFRNDHIDSNITLTPVIGLNQELDTPQPKPSPPKLLKSSLLDTIINVGMFPKMTTSVHNNLYNSELRDVIITEELRNSLPLNRLDNDFPNENKYSKSIFKKSFNSEDDSNHQKSISLPNEETIKELLLNREQTQKKLCSEEFRNYTPFSELWDKLTTFLDVAMKKLEEAITEKITQEMKKTLDRLDKYINTSKGNSKDSKSETDLKKESQEANIINAMESESKSLQCGSIQNNVLDELVKKINLEGLKILKSPPLRLKDNCKISDDFFEVLKPTVVACASNDKGNRDSLVASSSEGIDVKYTKLQYLPLFIITVFRFVKENLLVITSVPLFCFALFLIYTFLVVLANI